jgi:hypothetical protein
LQECRSRNGTRQQPRHSSLQLLLCCVAAASSGGHLLRIQPAAAAEQRNHTKQPLRNISTAFDNGGGLCTLRQVGAHRVVVTQHCKICG